jgi:hypothetical protein
MVFGIGHTIMAFAKSVCDAHILRRLQIYRGRQGIKAIFDTPNGQF